ncbi:phenylalanine--tRNA ligase subunit beta [Sulfuracidifex tepidarius]|uniref:Phenylalanine--tRNA ligase beta subunit n=1 Tax=Sulfuracidifex tepidarius TaxID=1294262 RepID=A0A510E4E2_9CREN|nr:phenylalanine--tRNA ligase subunit beta [Sulfuracidifex tepidarius]BBG27402.1 Phenylalanine--tRNA ligase beta subunit [Sulfuracidifex tepidarius]
MVTINLDRDRLLRKLKVDEKELEDLLFNLKSESKVIGDDIEIEVNADRPDLFSSDGIKRAIEGLKEISLGEPVYEVNPSDYVMKICNVKRRPYAIATIVKNVELDDKSLRELIQFQEKLHGTIGRKRKKVAIGIHDLSKIKSKTIFYKEIPLNYKFIPLGEAHEEEVKKVLSSTLQGKEYGNLSTDWERGVIPSVIEENGKVMSIPPVINSEHTRVTEKTSDLFIDVTGTSLDAVTQTINIIASNLAEGGGKIYSVKLESNLNIKFMERRKIQVNTKNIVEVLGIRLSDKEIVHLLAKDRMDFELSSKTLRIPPYRVDISRDEDVAEDVAMMYGYSRIEPTKLSVHERGSLETITLLERSLKDLCLGSGFIEVFTYVLTRKEYLTGEYVTIANPITEEYNAVRNSLIPVFMDFLSRNQSSRFPIRIFESADVVVRDEESDTGYRNDKRLALAIMDSKANYEDIQAPLHQVLLNLGFQPSYIRKESPYFINGRSASIVIGNEEVGQLGEVSPELLDKFGIQYPVVSAEISLSKIMKHFL